MPHFALPGHTPPVDPFRFTYTLSDHGWADTMVWTPGGSIEMGVSYLSDSLGDLLVAVNSILSGDVMSTAMWWDEPGELTWRFDRVGSQLSMTVTFRGEIEESEVAVVASLAAIFTPLVLAAEQVLIDFGEVGYWIRWKRFMFPTTALRAAQAQLGMPSRMVPSEIEERFDPLLAPAIKRWNRYLREQEEIGSVAAWALAQLSGPRVVDETTSAILLHLMDIASQGDSVGNARCTSRARYRMWEREFRQRHA